MHNSCSKPVRDVEAPAATRRRSTDAISQRRTLAKGRVAYSHRAAKQAMLIKVANWLRWRRLP
jgi:hypothetical protein